ncbi:MAG: hypothetical protein AAGJ68_10485 [Pseudomonadota bacterium]
MRGVLALMGLLAVSFAASASTVHKVRFSQPAAVLVWQDDILVGQGDRIVLREEPSLEDLDTPGSGELVPISAGIVPAEQRILFRVASNTGFAVRVANSSEAARVSLNVMAIGENAAVVGSDLNPTGDFVFHQTTKTAARSGSPVSQSIALEVTWAGGAAPFLEVVTQAP